MFLGTQYEFQPIVLLRPWPGSSWCFGDKTQENVYFVTFHLTHSLIRSCVAQGPTGNKGCEPEGLLINLSHEC